MASVKCKQCKKEVSALANTCPHCGVKNPDPKGLIKGIFGLAIIAGAAWFFFHDTNKNETAPPSPQVTAAAASTSEKDHTEAIYEKDYGDKWAFTFDRAVLICDKQAAFISDPMSGIIYPLTGLAQTRMKDMKEQAGNLDDVWKDDPAPYGVKINVGPFIDRALKLCE